MAATKESKTRVGIALAEYVARGLFDSTHGADPALEEGDPEALIQDVNIFSQLWFSQEEHTDLDEAIAGLPLVFFDFEYDAAEWHHHYKPPDIYARAHLLRIAHGWSGAKKLHEHLRTNPILITALGLNNLPDKSTFHRAWQKFSPEHRRALEDATREVVHMARYYGVPAPARAFQPEQERERRTREVSARQLTIERTEEIWEQTKPFVSEEFHLDRAPNWSIPEANYWQQHAYAGLKGKYIETAARSDDFRNRDTPSGSEHRRQVKKLDPWEVRENVQNVTKRLIKRARQRGEFDRKVTVAIDKTKGPVHWHGDVERDEDGKNIEPWKLGYKDKRPYYQIETIQIVGESLPIILDFVPVRRGDTRAGNVKKLLEAASEMVNIGEVQADREYDVEAVRDVVEEYGAVYRTAGKVTGLKGTCTKLRRKNALGYVIEEGGLNGANTRKTVFVPARNTDVFDQDTADDDESAEDESDTDTNDPPDVRQEMIEEFGATFDVEEEETQRMFGDVIDEIREEEENRPESQIYGSKRDVDAYAIFKTNDPDVHVTGNEDVWDTVEVAARAVRPYRSRWGIEEGNKKLKQFMARTKSDDHCFRFFNMGFSIILYNVWRLVDLLVQLSLEGEYDYSPLVTADEFLTCAEEHFDLDTPPPPTVRGAV